MDGKHPDGGLGSVRGIQAKAKPERELLFSKKQSEAEEELRVSHLRRTALYRPRQPTELMMSSSKPVKNSKDDNSQDMPQQKFRPGQIGLFRTGIVTYESAKYKIEECLNVETGQLFSLKTITVDSRMTSSTKWT